MSESTHQIPRSGKFLAPGLPLPPASLALVRQTLFKELQTLALDRGLRLDKGRDPEEHVLSSPDLMLPESCDVAEAGLKRLLRCLSADLIGGANVTRLDRAITHSHPRLPYRRALRIVGRRGWRLNLGEDLPPAAQASLIRFCGLLPVQILYLPDQQQPTSHPPTSQGFCTIVPWGGQVIQAALPLPGHTGQAIFRLRNNGLLQFVLGLADTVS